MGLPETYGVFFWVGVIAACFGGIQTYRIFEFIMNRKYEPRFSLMFYAMTANVAILEILLGVTILPLWRILTLPFVSLLTKVFVLLVPVGMVGSPWFVWNIERGIADWRFLVSYLMFLSPFAVLAFNVVLLRIGIVL